VPQEQTVNWRSSLSLPRFVIVLFCCDTSQAHKREWRLRTLLRSTLCHASSILIQESISDYPRGKLLKWRCNCKW
jgi:hypothetical protein